MASVSTYLNFNRNTETAFNFYKSVFGTEFVGPIMRMGEAPAPEGAPPLSEEDKNLVMHVALPTIGGHQLMGTDAAESMGFKLNMGNNIHINLSPDSKEETDKLFAALSAGGMVTMPLEDQFWGDYFGSCTDKFGVHWMFNCPAK
ncbi:VOC family protein [Marinoscillum sp. MHG1-6]|uniref:VOC family protein n=1 Tax=Marinoscillum sp. MHG1-6 TaxID=2959627 RepID=UPI0021575207|nr:VOC family protein [Marinoscillum sp. MHG1-6]